MKRSALDGSQHTNFIYLLPGLLFYAAFVFGPILAALALSLTSWDGLTMTKWVGLGNYADLFSDSRFYIALSNNAELMIFY
ncbi:sugar ABC transporter permease, partial [Rhizobium ruizarguesonis]